MRNTFAGSARAALVVRVLVVAVLGVAVSSCGPPEPPRSRPAACTVQPLRVPTGFAAASAVTGGDRTGRYLVGTGLALGPNGRRLLLWDNGTPTAVEVAGADTFTDVNSHGVAVGHGADADGSPFSFVYRAGEIARFAGGSGVALAINDRNVSVGYLGTRPALWRSPGAPPELLPLPADGWRGEALDIGDDAVIVGRVFPPAPSSVSRAYIWLPDGSHRFLPGDGAVAVAHAGHWAVGRTGTVPTASIRWDLDTLAAQALTTSPLVANVVNANGSVAGSGPPEVLAGGSAHVDLRVDVAGSRPDDEIDVRALNDDETLAAGTIGVLSSREATPIRIAVQWRCR